MHLHSETIFILAVEHLHGLDGLWDGPTTPDKHAINVESEREIVGDILLKGWGYWLCKWRRDTVRRNLAGRNQSRGNDQVVFFGSR